MESNRINHKLHQEIYDWLTAQAAITLTELAKESRAHFNWGNMQPWSVAQGALRYWSDMAGIMASQEDRERLESIIAGMSRGADEA